MPVLKIKGVEHQQLLLDVIDTPVSALRLPVTRYVVHIDDVQIACTKEISRLEFRGRSWGLLGETRTFSLLRRAPLPKTNFNALIPL